MKKILPLSLVTAVTLFGSAYKIPQQSLNSTALAGAYVSHTTSADAVYYNPAHMEFLKDGRAVDFLVFERDFWSSYKRLRIEAKDLRGGTFTEQEKNWDDANTYRIGITHLFNDRWMGMAGYSFLETPVPDETLSYELPLGDANVFVLGFRYKANEKVDVGLGYLIDIVDKRSVNNPYVGETTFKDSVVHMLTFGVSYRY